MPSTFLPKAQYAFVTLLRPLGLRPDWVSPSEVGSSGIYYGTQTPQEGLVIIAAASTISYFERRQAYPAEQVQWHGAGDERWPYLFQQADGTSPDPIASAFFWLSGWQEHTVAQRDQHGRFPYAASLQATLGTATQPCVDGYREYLAAQLKQRGVEFHRRKWSGKGWAFCPTHDIDYLKKWRKGMIWREVVHYFLLNHRSQTGTGRWSRLGQFVKAWARPGDVYRKAFTRMAQVVEAANGTATYFMKTGATSPHDVLYPIQHAFLRKHMPPMEADGFEFGLHPSYYGHTRASVLAAEKQQLDAVLSTASVSVRQHYLRYDPSLTPLLHHKSGFAIDSTLGFAEHEGFRHGTCLPFRLFDCDANRVLDIWEMPLALMDGALFNRRNLSLQEATEQTQALMQICARFGGVCVGLWHNTLWDELDFPDWGAHFENTVVHAAEQQATIASLKMALSDWKS